MLSHEDLNSGTEWASVEVNSVGLLRDSPTEQPPPPTYVLGVSGGPRGSHDPGAVLFRNGTLIASGMEERFNRYKGSISCFPTRSVQTILDVTGIAGAQIEMVAYPGFTYQDMPARWRGWLDLNFRIQPKSFVAVHHQMCHVLDGFRSSGLDSALIVALDGIGEQTCGAVALGENAEIGQMRTIARPNLHSVGFFWNLITQLLGFQFMEEAYKTMGMASYGEPSIDVSNLLRFDQDSGLPLINPDYINDDRRIAVSKHPEEPFFTQKLLDDYGWKVRRRQDNLSQFHFDLAASAQERLESVVLEMVSNWLKFTRQRKFVFTGGVALNSKLNATLARESGCDFMFVPQNPGDGGLSRGAALKALEFGGTPFTKESVSSLQHISTSRTYSDLEVQQAATTSGYKHSPVELSFVGSLLAQNAIIGFFCRGGEQGPRALGHRSILANPRDAKMKDIVNARIKFRESFRPFAPVVRDIDADEFFDLSSTNYSFMSHVVKAKSKASLIAPAVVHTDETSRVQVLSKSTNEPLYNLLSIMASSHGQPILLNTSFNLAGEPIVESPQDAIRTFASSGLDYLWLQGLLISKK